MSSGRNRKLTLKEKLKALHCTASLVSSAKTRYFQHGFQLALPRQEAQQHGLAALILVQVLPRHHPPPCVLFPGPDRRCSPRHSVHQKCRVVSYLAYSDVASNTSRDYGNLSS